MHRHRKVKLERFPVSFAPFHPNGKYKLLLKKKKWRKLEPLISHLLRALLRTPLGRRVHPPIENFLLPDSAAPLSQLSSPTMTFIKLHTSLVEKLSARPAGKWDGRGWKYWTAEVGNPASICALGVLMVLGSFHLSQRLRRFLTGNARVLGVNFRVGGAKKN